MRIRWECSFGSHFVWGWSLASTGPKQQKQKNTHGFGFEPVEVGLIFLNLSIFSKKNWTSVPFKHVFFNCVFFFRCYNCGCVKRIAQRCPNNSVYTFPHLVCPRNKHQTFREITRISPGHGRRWFWWWWGLAGKSGAEQKPWRLQISTAQKKVMLRIQEGTTWQIREAGNVMES